MSRAFALLLTLLISSAASAERARVRPRDNALGLSLTIGGVLLASVGGALVGYGARLSHTLSCPAWPQSAEVCRGLASDYQTAGWSILSVGSATGIAGGILLGVQAR
jgi:hypothetical protein